MGVDLTGQIVEFKVLKDALNGVCGTVQALQQDVRGVAAHTESVGHALAETQNEIKQCVEATVREVLSQRQAITSVAEVLQPTVQGQQDIMQRIRAHDQLLGHAGTHATASPQQEEKLPPPAAATP